MANAISRAGKATNFPAQCELLAASWLIAGQRPVPDAGPSPYSLLDCVRTSAGSDFRGMGLNHGDLVENMHLHGYGGIRAMLQDHGMVHPELEPLMGWWENDPADTQWRRTYDELLEAARQLGARQIKIKSI